MRNSFATLMQIQFLLLTSWNIIKLKLCSEIIIIQKHILCNLNFSVSASCSCKLWYIMSENEKLLCLRFPFKIFFQNNLAIGYFERVLLLFKCIRNKLQNKIIQIGSINSCSYGLGVLSSGINEGRWEAKWCCRLSFSLLPCTFSVCCFLCSLTRLIKAFSSPKFIHLCFYVKNNQKTKNPKQCDKLIQN